jgi:hypothetical protein
MGHLDPGFWSGELGILPAQVAGQAQRKIASYFSEQKRVHVLG